MTHISAEKGYKGFGMEGFTARWYASLTRKGLEEFKALARRVAAEIRPASRVLEVAPGPGYFAIELARLGGYRITGVDISHTMVDIARRNAAQAGVDVDFRQGDAARLPCEDACFDFLFCRAAFKNFARPLLALQEMYRVLAPGGRARIIDLRKDASRESLDQAVESMRLGAVDALATKLIFRFLLLKRAYTRSQLEQLVSQTRFLPVAVIETPASLELSLERSRAS